MSQPFQLQQHPQRVALHNEVHARPPEALSAPLVISHLVMACDASERERSRQHLASLLRDHHQAPPDAHSTHLRTELGPFRLRWELHTEFVSWTFSRAVDAEALGQAQLPTAAAVVPQEWLAALPGRCFTAMHLSVLPTTGPDPEAWVKRLFQEESLVASQVADGYAEVYTDFAIHADGFSHMLLLAGSLSPRRLGRLVQRLLEIETYRMAALLGLPVAREAGALLSTVDQELAALAEAIRAAARDDEPQLLDRLTRLAGQVESQYALTHSRFSASAAYFELVDKRIADISETRLAGLQTIGEFMERRLTPARSTCEWAARRQDALSQRVSRISNLLRTRVEIEQQQSSQDLLTTMNQRQDLQLKLQSTVEGLSVAAISYYIVGLVGYVAKGATKVGWPLSAETTTAVAIPVVLLSVWWSLRRMHHRIVGGARH
ncbi:DUF3422 domain-containing protein [Curvibacter sp. RS43]|uniref:DUF3422 domain-containing protein n=1 Tax=Curvibacter microcysteis TaxID=3026419 RepID=A0ABT5MN22_9BURK|nr:MULTISPECIES: DUF3422 domain-containing protein [unclassified Curvibacter]MDD0811865.1 DUF3422 domain-containing protein [Curvibacter sp. RS43]MDD0816630.1 DUF3422 domain-containing protein [Curvibacter sp. HBC28]